jgi:hypothetical protein
LRHGSYEIVRTAKKLFLTSSAICSYGQIQYEVEYERKQLIMPETSVLPSTSANPPPARPAADLAFFAPPPLIEGEDTGTYDDLLARISGAIKPSDILEEIWVRDVVDLTWDAFRLRRLKAKLLTATAHEGMAATLRPLVDWDRAHQLAWKWAARDKTAVATVETTLAAAGVTMDGVMARTLSLHISDIERIDRMESMAESRRNFILREIERHRESFARTLRRALEDVEDAEFEVITPGGAARGEVA